MKFGCPTQVAYRIPIASSKVIERDEILSDGYGDTVELAYIETGSQLCSMEGRFAQVQSRNSRFGTCESLYQMADWWEMIRTVDTNRSARRERSLIGFRYCADCGIPHRPRGQIDIESPSTNGVAYANPWLGIFICHEYTPSSRR